MVEFDDGCGNLYKLRAFFLAAAGIAEFKDCSLADEIVRQIVKVGFGYFDDLKSHSWTITTPMAERIRETLKETDRGRAIFQLIELIRISQYEDTRRQAAYCLGQIDKTNPVAIDTLVELIRNSGSEYTRWQAAYSLGTIDRYNPVAISTLVELSCVDIRNY
ncbi:HEAT repeat domain-containing protein [Tychonema sp. LEGE 07199]|uniref:HEAT repeat domain-containing protein n=1 Tax=unclassified Tychonema TaxID=2642144 RepID=UPI001881F7FC|nr:MULTISPECIES: HEAT repeat domain-containing protein [unclassified Tychonema]MBE9122850.1 HEAT repeat domain-containing protein [Tychonema sp. LEGE 07199]MBE9131507.1 HEAT repeat domain-containing protein [Tychonema sp. LEGE 07196]